MMLSLILGYRAYTSRRIACVYLNKSDAVTGTDGPEPARYKEHILVLLF